MNYFFLPHIHPDEQILLPLDEAKHLRATRARDGEEVYLTDGKGHRYTCRLSWQQKEAVLTVIQQEALTPSLPRLTVGIGPTKNADRIEWFIEKSVEIGIHAIFLMDCDNGERSLVRMDRIERIAVAALKQSQKCWLPELYPLKPFRQVIESLPTGGQGFIAHCHAEANRQLLRDVLKPGIDTMLLIGPEGDFSEDEVYLAEQKGFRSVSLGQSRLRTETAGLTAVHTFELINQH